MDSKILFVFLFFVATAFAEEPEEEENLDQELVGEIMANAMQCSSAGNINFNVCKEMFDEAKDLKDEKYDSCKCMIPCVAKKMGVMSEDGKFDHDAILKRMNELKTEKYKKEAERVYPICKSEPGINCEGGFNFFRCGMKNSPMAQEMTKGLLSALG